MRMRIRAIVAAASVASSVLVTAPAALADSAPPCGTVITSDFVLETDMYCPTEPALIVAGGPGITVDLGGHHLVGGFTASRFNSGVMLDGNRDVTVVNGTIRGFDLGVFGAGGRSDGEPNTLTRLRLTGNRVGFAGWSGSRARIHDNRIDANGTGLVFVSNARGTVVDNLIEDNRSCGAEHTESSGNVYRSNIIRDNGGCGIRSFIGGGATIARNRISGHAVGVVLEHVHSRGNQVLENEVFDNGVGVRIGGSAYDQVDRTLVSQNRFVNNAAAGLLFVATAGSVAG